MGGGLLPQIILLGTLAEPLSTVAGSLTSIASAIAMISENLANLDTDKLEALSKLVITTAIAAPMMAAAGVIGDIVSGVAGGGEEGSAKSESNEKLIAKIDELIVAVKQGKNINMDGRRVSTSLQLTSTNT
jgi:hypothetical protein